MKGTPLKISEDENEKAFFVGLSSFMSAINRFLSKKHPSEPLGNHIKILGGYAFKSSEYRTSGIPVIRISDFQDEKIDLSNVQFYEEKEEYDKYRLLEGDIIIALTGGTIGKLGIVQEGLGMLYLNQRVGKFQVLHPKEFYDKYVYWLARSIQEKVKSFGYGGAQPNISGSQIEEMKFPIPNKETQKKIVEFLDNLKDNNLQDKEYFNKETEEEIKKLLVTIRGILNSKTNDKENISLISSLRSSILQQAVQGKLVKQDPKDESASELLKKIKAEKEKLIKEGMIRRDKPLAPISEDEIPYELPRGWEWVRLNELVSILGDGLHGTPAYSDNGDYFFINGNNLDNGKIVIKSNTKKVSFKEYEKYKKDLTERSILVSINGTLGNVAFYNKEKVILGKSACYFNLFNSINKDYIKLLINSAHFLEYVLKSATRTTIDNVSLQSMRLLPVPLPSIAEQKRIVEKVDKLMDYCDELEKQVKENQENAEKLMSAVLKEGFEE